MAAAKNPGNVLEIIEATAGCSHNKCTFCGAYRETCFKVAPMEQVHEDIMEAASYYRNPKRVFLLSGDAFVLSYEKLSKIACWINEAMPSVETITMFSTIPDIARKTDEELRKLADAKIKFRELCDRLISYKDHWVVRFKGGYEVEVREYKRM